jgi:hypothetical protein
MLPPAHCMGFFKQLPKRSGKFVGEAIRCEEGGESDLAPAFAIRCVALVAQRHHGDVAGAGVLFQVLNELPAVVAGHWQCRHDDVRVQLTSAAEGVCSVRGGHHVEPCCGKGERTQCERVYVAIHEEDEWPWRNCR